MTLKTRWAIVLGFAVALSQGEALAQGNQKDNPDFAPGLKVLSDKGCIGCHSLDGTKKQGPSLVAVWGVERKVKIGEKEESRTFDEPYLKKSISQPNDEVVVGYEPGFMPVYKLTDEEISAVAKTLTILKEPLPAPSQGTLIPLLLGCILFVLGHLGLSAHAIRGPAVAKLGNNGFQGIYSLVAFAAMGLMVWGFHVAPFIELWSLGRWSRWVPIVTMPIAVFLMVCGFSTKSATAVGQESVLKEKPGPQGIFRITRHPALWGFALWGATHLIPNGDIASSLLFVAIFVLSIAGMLHIDSRRKMALGDQWDQYAAQTSLIPFAAIVSGRASLSLREIGIVRLLVSIVIYVGILHSHRLLIGVSALP